MSTCLQVANLNQQKYFDNGKKDSVQSHFTEELEKNGNYAIIWKAQRCLEYI